MSLPQKMLFQKMLFWKMWHQPVSGTADLPKRSAPWPMFLAGIALTLGNPKIMVFYLALLPAIIGIGFTRHLIERLGSALALPRGLLLRGGLRHPPSRRSVPYRSYGTALWSKRPVRGSFIPV